MYDETAERTLSKREVPGFLTKQESARFYQTLSYMDALEDLIRKERQIMKQLNEGPPPDWNVRNLVIRSITDAIQDLKKDLGHATKR